MPILGGGLRGCYRCAAVWRRRGSREPAVCPRCKSRRWDVPKLERISTGHGQGIEDILGPKREEALRLAREHGFGHVRVFGSVRRSEATRWSDVDLLVAGGPHTSILDVIDLELDLEALLGRRVDVGSDESLHWLIRPQVLFEAVTL